MVGVGVEGGPPPPPAAAAAVLWFNKEMEEEEEEEPALKVRLLRMDLLPTVDPLLLRRTLLSSSWDTPAPAFDPGGSFDDCNRLCLPPPLLLLLIVDTTDGISGGNGANAPAGF